jgi:signal peptidase I
MATVGIHYPLAGRSARNAPRPLVRRCAGALVALALVLACWSFLAPAALAGRDTYVVTDGISMLPHFHAGDLVILRKESSYHVGEVAGYRNGELGVVVMHRIIAIRNGHYVFKGDNNNFIDSYEPTKSQIVGAEWLHLSRIGHFLDDLRVPGVAAAVLASLWIFSFGRPQLSRRRRRRHHLVS